MAKGSKLSPIPYLVHNKKRASVLIVSLSLFFVMIYVLGYFMGAIGEPLVNVCIDSFKRTFEVHVIIDNESLGEYETREEWDELVRPILYEKQEELQKVVGDDDVFLVRGGFASLKLMVGATTISSYYFENTDDMNRYSQIIDAKLVEGRWPENPGELVVDTNSYINRGDELLSYLGSSYKIVGKVDTPVYAMYGLPAVDEHNYFYLVAPSDYQKVNGKYVEDQGFPCIPVDYDLVMDNAKNEINGLDDIKQLVTIVATVLLAICVTVVFALHIRDRREEWCLFESIGFTSGQIYAMALKEMLICFVIAAGIGVLVSGAAVVVLDNFVIYPLGLGHVQMIRPKDALLAIEMYALIFALCQVPVFFTIRGVQTVDNIEE